MTQQVTQPALAWQKQTDGNGKIKLKKIIKNQTKAKTKSNATHNLSEGKSSITG